MHRHKKLGQFGWMAILALVAFAGQLYGRHTESQESRYPAYPASSERLELGSRHEPEAASQDRGPQTRTVATSFAEDRDFNEQRHYSDNTPTPPVTCCQLGGMCFVSIGCPAPATTAPCPCERS